MKKISFILSMLCAMLLTFSCVWEKASETDLPEESGSISIHVD